MSRRFATLAATIFAVAGLSLPAQAADLTLAHGFSDGSAIDLAYEELARVYEAETGSSVQLYAMSLLDIRQTSQGIRDGSADVGAIMLPYHPAEYSESLLIGDLSTLLNSGEQVRSIGAAFSGAQMEYIMFECDDCRTQYRRQNQVFLGSGTGTQFALLCSTPIRTGEDLRGKKIKASMPNFQRWIESYGAIAVNLPGNEMYQGLSQGVINCTINAPAELTNFGLFDVVKAVTVDVPSGTYGGTALSMMNHDIWKSMSAGERTAFLKGSARASAVLTTEFAKRSIEDLKTLEAQGGEILQADPAFREATLAFQNEDLATISEQYASTYKLAGIDGKIASFTKLLAKWKTLTNELDPTDAEGLAELYWNELLSKVDVESYEVD